LGAAAASDDDGEELVGDDAHPEAVRTASTETPAPASFNMPRRLRMPELSVWVVMSVSP
jgi:hypothetical protein